MTSVENNGTEAAPPLKVELHIAAAQSRDAFDIWHAALADMFEVALKRDAPTFRGDVIGFHLGDCLTFNNALGRPAPRAQCRARPALGTRPCDDRLPNPREPPGRL
jgi:hypothetical protein